MAVQLYEQAYSVQYWKARHILWWAAIEALFGNAEDAAMARIYAFFGNGDLSKGFDHSIYERADFPPSFQITSANDHTLGEVLRSFTMSETSLRTATEYRTGFLKGFLIRSMALLNW